MASRLMRVVAAASLAVAVGLGAVSALGGQVGGVTTAWAEPASATAPQPRAHWTFDKEGSPAENTGTEKTLALTHAGVSVQASNVKSLGKIMRFDNKGVDVDVKVAGALNNQGNYTISAWVKADLGIDNGAKTAIFQLGGQGNTLLYQLQDGYYETFIGGSAHKFARKNAGRGTWHHVVLVKQGQPSKMSRLYLDGVLAGEGTWQNNLAAGTFDLILGEHKSSSTMDRFQGNMDELCIFGEALSEQQVKAHYDSYDAVKRELAVFNVRAEVEALVERAEGLMAQDDGSAAYDALKDAIDAAREALKGTDAVALDTAKADLENAIGAVFSLGVTVSVDPAVVEQTIDRGIFGINHRYAFNGYGSYDSVAQQVKPEFAALYDQANFGSIRYPGGTISNLFNWKETLGEQGARTPQIHGFYRNAKGIAPNFGISEIGTFAADHGSEIIYVYALGRGDANDAADLVEFLNAEVGTNPNGGTEWAKVREANGHREPYNVRYFELGNEMNQGGAGGEGTTSQQYWTAFVEGKGALDAYIDGGTASFTKEYAITRGDWNHSKSFSTGEPNQEFGMRYALVPLDERAEGYSEFTAVKKGSVHVYVNDEEWTETQDLKAESADAKKFQMDWKTGYFTFGDGAHGKIPAKGAQVKVSYKVDRDGFIEISESMRDTMAQINADRQREGKPAGEIHVYSSFESESFFTQMANRGKSDLYDGMAIHPYTHGSWSNDMAPEAFYLQAMKLGDNAVNHVAQLTSAMRRISGDDGKVPVISEYGIFRSTHNMVRSQAHALYIARQVMEFIKLGSPYIQKHCLVDWYTPNPDPLGPTQQAVIQAVPGAGASTATGEGPFTFFKTPSALVFEMYNGMDDAPGFGGEILKSSMSESPALSNGVQSYDALVSRDGQGNIYAAVNYLDLTRPGGFTLKIAGEDLSGRTIEVRTVSGEDCTTENTPADPDRVSIERTELVADTANPHFTLEPHSFTIVKVLAPKAPAPEPAPEPEPEPEPEPVEKCTVTFDDRLDGTKDAVIVVEKGRPVARPQDPVLAGWVFEGWFADGHEGGWKRAWDFDDPVTRDLVLTAKWSKATTPGGQGGQGQHDQGGSTPELPSGPASGPQAGGGLPQTGDASFAGVIAASAAGAVAIASGGAGRRRHRGE